MLIIEKDVRPLLITVEQLAKLLQISTRTVWRLRKTGKLPKPIEIGGSVRWNAETVRQWIAGDCPGCSDGRIDSIKHCRDLS